MRRFLIGFYGVCLFINSTCFVLSANHQFLLGMLVNALAALWSSYFMFHWIDRK